MNRKSFVYSALIAGVLIPGIFWFINSNEFFTFSRSGAVVMALAAICIYQIPFAFHISREQKILKVVAEIQLIAGVLIFGGNLVLIFNYFQNRFV